MVDKDAVNEIFLFLHETDIIRPEDLEDINNNDYYQLNDESLWSYGLEPILENVHVFVFQHESGEAISNLLDPDEDQNINRIEDLRIEEFLNNISIWTKDCN